MAVGVRDAAEALPLDALQVWLGAWGYPALLAALIATGLGSPIHEDLLLLAAGYLIVVGVFQWPVTFAIAVTGVVASDLVLYFAGRQLGRHAALPRNRFLSASLLERITRWFARVGVAAVFVARLVPGTRVVVFVAAGVRSIPLTRFVIPDLLGALIWVSAMLAAGGAIARSIDTLDAALRQ